MSNIFFYENGQGEIRDENGEEVMDWEENTDPFNIRTLMTLSRYKMSQKPIPERVIHQLHVQMEGLVEDVTAEKKKVKRNNIYSDKQCALFYYFNKIKLWKAAPSGRMAGIAERTAQTWAKRLKEDLSWNIYEKDTNKINRTSSQLQDEHKERLTKFYYEYPQASKQDAVASLIKAFEGFSLKRTSVGNFILYDCNLTFKRITPQPLARNSEQIQKRFE
jgi:hypothetical protein